MKASAAHSVRVAARATAGANNLAATHRSLWLGSRPRPATGVFFCGRLGAVLHFFRVCVVEKVRTDPTPALCFFLPTAAVMVIDRRDKIDAGTEVHWRTVIVS